MRIVYNAGDLRGDFNSLERFVRIGVAEVTNMVEQVGGKIGAGELGKQRRPLDGARVSAKRSVLVFK